MAAFLFSKLLSKISILSSFLVASHTAVCRVETTIAGNLACCCKSNIIKLTKMIFNDIRKVRTWRPYSKEQAKS